MGVQDPSQHRRIARLTQLSRELEQSRTADQTLQTVQRALAEMEGFVGSMFISTRGLSPGEYRVVRLNLSEDREDDWIRPPHDDEEHKPLRSGGVVGSIVQGGDPQILQDVEWSRDPYFGDTLESYRSVIAVPIVGEHLPINWALLLKRSPERFTTSDLERVMARAVLVAALMEKQLLAAELARAHEQIDRDAQRVGQLQRALLPASLPEIAGLEIAASYEPSGRAGGDLYDFFPLAASPAGPEPDATCTRWCILVGDAAGHDLAAALVMAIVQAVLRAHPSDVDGPAALLMHANSHLCMKRLGGFFTAFLGVYEPAARRLTYANAGHPAPLLKRSSSGDSSPSSFQLLDSALRYPLGIDETERFSEATVQLERGDTLLLYTDGITEARSEEGDLFGPERLERIVRDSCGDPQDLIDRLREAVRAYQHGRPALDDQTLVAALVL